MNLWNRITISRGKPGDEDSVTNWLMWIGGGGLAASFGVAFLSDMGGVFNDTIMEVAIAALTSGALIVLGCVRDARRESRCVKEYLGK
ncbi:hypothetical protein HOI83_02115 [Candidatus Uhrbacteria bacterium]|jgi:hypothetical protein|nr:hypothetical protein [Candidatus Uhrbacteria bacterium]